MSARRLKVVLCWHMHQPEYRDLVSGEYQLPWTYLHAIKDYVDMAAHLEAVPGAHAVVNFAPVLLDQIADYADQVERFLHDSGPIRDPLLAALESPAPAVDIDHRLWLMKACLRANEERLIQRFPAYREIAGLARWFIDKPEALLYVAEQLLADLVVWYHLAWLGETVRRQDRRVQRLMEKGQGYTLHERRELLAVIGEQVGGLIGRYRALAESGRIELSVSPYAHPIVPLMLDLASAREAMPDVALPKAAVYPGGEDRVHRHLQRAIETFEAHFGFRPRGCWPSEGGVSDATLALLGSFGFDWAASGESVLRNSLAAQSVKDVEGGLHRPYCVRHGRLACFFRDDGLSDLVGFTYADWHADDAVGNLLQNLENIADATGARKERVVSVILDGENAWEYYPENGYYFLHALYRRLAEHPRLDLTTFSDCLDSGMKVRSIPGVVAGSWVYGTFSTWIGDPGKNRGWEMLIDAKRAYDEAVAGLSPEERRIAEHILAACEGSDWFWWFGDYNPADTVSDFERLFRLHLSNLYQAIRREPPEYLCRSFTYGQGAPARGGVMRKGQGATPGA